MQAQGLPAMAISAATGENVLPLLYRVQQMLAELPPAEEPLETIVEITPRPDPKAFDILHPSAHEWVVEGFEIERTAAMTNWSYYESGLRFQRILQALGITEALRLRGVEEGDTVRIGAVELVWGYDNALGE